MDIEKGLGLKRTKHGAGDKEEAYIVGASNVKKFGIFLIFVSLVCSVVILTMKTDLKHESRARFHQQQRVALHKEALFNSKEHEMLDNKQQEAKLMKVLAIMQEHFGRDRREEDFMSAFNGKFAVAMNMHQQAVGGVLKVLDGNEQVVKYLQDSLSKAANSFHKEMKAAATVYAASILKEGVDSEAKLHALTQSVIDELKAEMKEEDREEKEEEDLDAKDPEWAAMDRDFKKNNPNSRSQDEKDVEGMIESFKEKVDVMRPAHMSATDAEKGDQLLMQLETAALTAEDFTALESDMKEMLVKYGKRPGRDIEGVFRQMVEESKFSSDRADVKEKLRKWEKDKISDAEMMVDIENDMKKGEVDPEWLEERQTKKEKSNMLKLGTEDHMEHIGDEAPGRDKTQLKLAPLKPDEDPGAQAGHVLSGKHADATDAMRSKEQRQAAMDAVNSKLGIQQIPDVAKLRAASAARKAGKYFGLHKNPNVGPP